MFPSYPLPPLYFYQGFKNERFLLQVLETNPTRISSSLPPTKNCGFSELYRGRVQRPKKRQVRPHQPSINNILYYHISPAAVREEVATTHICYITRLRSCRLICAAAAAAAGVLACAWSSKTHSSIIMHLLRLDIANT